MNIRAILFVVSFILIAPTTSGFAEDAWEEDYSHEWEFTNSSTRDFMWVTRLDMESDSLAIQLKLISEDEEFWVEEGIQIISEFIVSGLESCSGYEAKQMFLTLHVIVCLDGQYVYVIEGTDRDVIEAGAWDMMEFGYPKLPLRYELESMPAH